MRRLGFIWGVMVWVIGGMGCVSTSLIQQMSDDIDQLKKENQEIKQAIARLETDTAQPVMDSSESAEAVIQEFEQPPPNMYDNASEDPTPLPVPSLESDEECYAKGQEYYHDGKYREAIQMFEQASVLASSAELISRCYYWMGECFYAQGSFTRALDLFRKVYREYNSEPKAPDALLKIGFTYSELKDYTNAVQVLNEFIKKYPTHRAISVARDKLHWIETNKSGKKSADSTKGNKESRL